MGVQDGEESSEGGHLRVRYNETRRDQGAGANIDGGGEARQRMLGRGGRARERRRERKGERKDQTRNMR